MRLAWTLPAADDLEDVVDYISKDNPDAATKVATRIVERLTALSLVPRTGRPGRAPGTYEVVLTPYPYIAVYVILPDEMRVMRIRHGAQA